MIYILFIVTITAIKTEFESYMGLNGKFESRGLVFSSFLSGVYGTPQT